MYCFEKLFESVGRCGLGNRNFGRAALRLAKMRLMRLSIIPKAIFCSILGWEIVGRGNWRGTMRHMNMKMQIGGSHMRETLSIFKSY